MFPCRIMTDVMAGPNKKYQKNNCLYPSGNTGNTDPIRHSILRLNWLGERGSMLVDFSGYFQDDKNYL